MKPILLALVFIGCSLTALAADKKSGSTQALPKTDSVVWAGLDYSLVRMYGTQDFTEPAKIFPDMLDTWNVLFVSEGWAERAGKALGRRIVVDLGGMTERNKLAKPSQVIREDGADTLLAATHITDKDIADAVSSYKLTEKSGLGLVFIVDRLVKLPQKGCVYIVCFDIESRKVLASQRGIYKAGGFGFRNYWFRVVKDAIPDLKKIK